jgi:hypothetical protein
MTKYREMEEAFFTEESKEFKYEIAVFGFKNDFAKKLQLDKCLALQIVLIPRQYTQTDHNSYQTKSKRAKKLGLNIDEN